MRFILTFLVVAVASLTLTWYIGYDYNMYEYRLIKSIVVKVHDYIAEDDHKTADVDDGECHSWSTLNTLMQKIFERVFDSFGTVYQNAGHKLSENLADDINDISWVVDNFENRLASAIHSLPEYMYPVREIFESMQTNLLDINGRMILLSNELLQKIDDDYSKSHETMIYQFVKFLQNMGHIIEAEDDAALECICTASIRLDAITAAAMENENYCIVDAEYHFRGIFNATKRGLNLNLESTIETLTESNTAPVSMFDNFFQLPLHVSISH